MIKNFHSILRLDFLEETEYKIIVACGGMVVMYVLCGWMLDFIAWFLPEDEGGGDGEGDDGGDGGEGGEADADGGERRLFGLNQFYLNGPGSVAD